MFEDKINQAVTKLAADLERNVWNSMLQYSKYGFVWPSMSREDWWAYWNQMTEACPTCKDHPFNGGPSQYWTHSEHVGRSGSKWQPH